MADMTKLTGYIPRTDIDMQARSKAVLIITRYCEHYFANFTASLHLIFTARGGIFARNSA